MRFCCAMALVAMIGGSAVAQQAKTKHTNRLAREASPYLLLHAHNPTDWYPWGPEAFARARKEKKLVFLSIGYSSCYWCHVMERESFNHDAVAKVLNDSFVSIKVDREERPEIDHIYMTALHQFRSGGGWPLSMFLMPDGRPIIGGTYWPREDRTIEGENVPGFMTILKAVRDAYRDSPDKIDEQAQKIADATSRALASTALPGGVQGILAKLDRKLVDGVLDGLKEEFDPVQGGFGSPNRGFRGTKFPQPPRLELLLQESGRSKEAVEMVTLTLDKMAEGGIYDHVGGGFHRYSTERTWTVPHFEKMLYDNAQLVEVYAEAYRVTKKPLYRRIVEETLTYIKREMTSPEGAIYSSQDAETHHEEGRFYVWTDAELTAALPEKAELELVRRVYSADGKPNFEDKYHILRLAKPWPETAKDLKLTEPELQAKLEPLRRKLYAARAQRDRPLRNEIALTSWSGQMIAGLATAGRILDEPRYLERARRAADFILAKQLTKEGRLLHTYGAPPGQPARAAVDGYLEDYAFLVHGLLNLHDATKEKKWLDASSALSDTMLKLFGDEKAGGFYFTPHDGEKFFARAKDQYDGAQPSGNSMAARNLVRLAKTTGSERYRSEAERALKSGAAQLRLHTTAMPTMAHALALYLE